MQVNAISSQNTDFAQNFRGKRDNIDAFINLDDETIRQLAYLKTVESVDDKRHRKLDRGLMNLVPIAAGVVTAVASPKLWSKTGRIEKLIAFGETAAKWFAAFGIIDLVFAGKNKLDQVSEKSREFANKNPLLSFLATAGLSFAAIAGAKKGFGKLIDKYGVKLVGKFDGKISNALVKAGKKLDGNKALNWISKQTTKLSSKTPSALKNIGKGLLEWSPLLIGLGAVTHSADHGRIKAQEFSKNYTDLKDKQFELSKRRMTELAVQNDFMLTNPKNKEDVELIEKA